MNPAVELIPVYAKQLRTPSFGRYDSIMRQAQENGWGYEEFLLRLLEQEISARQENRKKQLIRQARFPLRKSLDNFNFARLPHIEEAAVWQLAAGDFVTKHENIIMMGNSGTGKTHLAIGLGMRLCSNGFTVKFSTAAGLVTELTEAVEARQLGRLEKQLSKVQVLIVDELSYLSFTKAQAELLFHVLSSRNERGSVLITTNLEFSRWNEIFQDAMLTTAVVDRLTHHSHILNMNGESFRLTESLKRKRETT